VINVSDKSKYDKSNAIMSEEELKIECGKLLKKIRQNKGLTQKKVALLCGVTPQLISKIEIGNTFPNLYLLKQLIQILDISLDELNLIIGNLKHSIVLSKEQSKLIDIIKKDRPSDELCLILWNLLKLYESRGK